VPESFLQLSLGRWLFGIPNQRSSSWRWCSAACGCWSNAPAIGQEIQAVGGNPAAARLAGINVDRIKILGFVHLGHVRCTDRHPARLAARQRHHKRRGQPICSRPSRPCSSARRRLRDGEFHILGTFVGVLIIAFGFNGLNIFGAPTFSQYRFPGRHPDRRRRAGQPWPHHLPNADLGGRSMDHGEANSGIVLRPRIRALEATALGRPHQRHVR
jgi:ribose transport system permease protein